MDRAHAYYIQSVIQMRNRYIPRAHKLFAMALNKMFAPVYQQFEQTHATKGLTDLIKETALVPAFKLIYSEVGKTFFKAEYTGLGGKSMKADSYDDWLDGQVSDFIQSEGADYVTKITETMRKQLKNYIEDNMINTGENIGAAKLASDLRKYFDSFNKVKAMTVARTEVGRASNWAGQTSRERFSDDNNVELVKTWLHAGSSDDDRESHVEASGQTVGNDAHFEIDGGYEPLYPQDGSGGAEEEANCNCTVFASRKK